MSEVMRDTYQNLSVSLVMDDTVRTQLRQGENAMTMAQGYVIDCPEVAQLVSDERIGLAKRIDAIKAAQKKYIEPAQQIIENAKEMFNPAIKALTDARDYLGKSLLTWDQQEKARIARETAEREAAERKVRQEAEAKAAAERARAEEKAREERRKAAEAEEARKKALAEGNARAAAAAAAEAAKANERAAAAIEDGNAKALQAQVAMTAMAVPVIEETKIMGSSIRDNWVAKLNQGLTEDDAKALIVQAAATNPQLLGVLKLDMPAINKLAKALKQVMQVPGFTAINEPSLSGSRK